MQLYLSDRNLKWLEVHNRIGIIQSVLCIVAGVTIAARYWNELFIMNFGKMDSILKGILITVAKWYFYRNFHEKLSTAWNGNHIPRSSYSRNHFYSNPMTVMRHIHSLFKSQLLRLLFRWSLTVEWYEQTATVAHDKNFKASNSITTTYNQFRRKERFDIWNAHFFFLTTVWLRIFWTSVYISKYSEIARNDARVQRQPIFEQTNKHAKNIMKWLSYFTNEFPFKSIFARYVFPHFSSRVFCFVFCAFHFNMSISVPRMSNFPALNAYMNDSTLPFNLNCGPAISLCNSQHQHHVDSAAEWLFFNISDGTSEKVLGIFTHRKYDRPPKRCSKLAPIMVS